jgi:hypothetical protein
LDKTTEKKTDYTQTTVFEKKTSYLSHRGADKPDLTHTHIEGEAKTRNKKLTILLENKVQFILTSVLPRTFHIDQTHRGRDSAYLH